MPKTILAIDPGTEESGWCLLQDGKVEAAGVFSNDEIIDELDAHAGPGGPELAIEMVASYGMPVGREVFETVVWIGRFCERWHSYRGALPRLVFRRDVKLHLCGNARAKDPNIRQALIDKLGPAGTKKAPGPTYGVKSHAWAALAVAVTAAETA